MILRFQANMPYYPLGRIFLLLLGAVLAEGQGTSTNYWPAAEWRTSSPERQGVDSRDLARIFGTVEQGRSRFIASS